MACYRIGQRLQTRRPQRPGVITVWIIIALPALFAMICFVTDIANLWLARVELEDTLEAAALAGVKTWSEGSRAQLPPHFDPDNFLLLDATRAATQAVAKANTVNGQAVSLNTNSSGGTANHGNFSLQGDIVLGSFPANAVSGPFTQNADVGCGRTTVTMTTVDLDIDIEVSTPAGQDTLDTQDAFNIRFTTATPGVSVTTLQIDLQRAPILSGLAIDDGVFDFGTTGVWDLVPAEGTGNGPAIDPSSDVLVLSSATGDGTGVLTLTFPPGEWTSGEWLRFGVDTDLVESMTGGGGSPPNSVTDFGGDFGESPGANGQDGRIGWSFGINGGLAAGNTIDERLQKIMGGRTARLQGKSASFGVTIVTVVGNNDFAVLTQKSVQVKSLWNTLFGLSIGPFDVSARATATARCVNSLPADFDIERPRLVHATSVN